MTEATKPKWAWDARANWIDIFDPSGEHWLQFDVDDDTRKATEEKVGKLVSAMNKHDELVAVAKSALEWGRDGPYCEFTGAEDSPPCDCGWRELEAELESALAAEAKVAEATA